MIVLGGHVKRSAPLCVSQRRQRTAINQLNDDRDGGTMPRGLMQRGEPRLAAGAPLVGNQPVLLAVEHPHYCGPLANFRRISEQVTGRDYVIV